MIYRKIKPNAQLFAIESWEPNVMVLEKKGVKVFKCDLERDRFPFENESVDVINANQILEHTKEIFWIFHEISRTLKIGGHLVIGIPNLASLHNRILLLFGKQPTCIQNHSAHVRGFTKSDMLKFLNIYGGYEMISFKGSNFYPFPPVIAKPLAKIFPNMAWGIFSFYLEKNQKI